VVVPKPAGLQSGDVLVLQVTADNNPTLSAVPPGWNPVLTQLNVTTGARVFVHSHVVADAAAEPASYTFTLSAAQRWGAVVGSFRGVDTADPFDTAASTRTDTTYRATSVTVPSVTTVTAGAMLVGGVGFDGRTVAVTPPSDWTEIGESTNGQVAEMAIQARPAAGATGTATWTFTPAAATAGWLRALRPAATGTPPPPAPTAPVASFTASPDSGVAPLPVQFTDTSTGTPTSWAWDFGNGQTSTAKDPAHTFTTAGTYTVTLRATNAAGTSPPVTGTVTVTAPPPAGAAVTAGASATAVSVDLVTAVTLPVPAGVLAGDVLVAQVTADNNPTMSTVPPGWTPVLAQLNVTTGARVFVYYRVVVAGEPLSHTFTLSAPQRWGAVVGSFRGVDTVDPFDTAATTKTDLTYSARSLTLPEVVTTTPGAMLVGGVGFDNRTVAVTPPLDWTEIGESTNGQVAQLSVQARPVAGATGTATWSFSTAAAAGGWLRALRPAPAP
jgi:PKD repeat protein